MTTFNATQFTLAPCYPMDEVRPHAVVVNGVDPLRGWRKAPRYRQEVDLVYHPVRKITVTAVRVGSDEFAVRTYWDADPKEVLELLKGQRKFSALTGKFSWSGGPAMMSAFQLCHYLVGLAKNCE